MKQNSNKLLLVGLIVCMSLFLVSFVSAMEWDNVKDYNSDTKTLTITNALGFGETLAKLQLISPQNVRVGAGYQKVAEFTIDNFKLDYGNAFQDMKFYDMNLNKKEINREFDYKYLTYVDTKIIEYETICTGKYYGNGTAYQNCTQKEIGSHQEDIETWIKFSDIDEIPSGKKVTIGIFTEVQVGDYVDWVPKFMGETISEWATWTASLNVGLVSYYNMDEQDVTGTGNIIDSLGLNNGTNVGTDNVSGILGTAYNFAGENEDAINLPTSLNAVFQADFTVDMWVYPDTDGTNEVYYGGRETGGLDKGLRIGKVGTYFLVLLDYGAGGFQEYDTFELPSGSWYYLTVRRDGQNITMWANGDLYDSGSDANYATNITHDNVTKLGAIAYSDTTFNNGTLDEIGFWNRSLTDAEIVQRYNGGTGITYDADPTGVTVTLNSPADDSTSSTNLITFNATAVISGVRTAVNMSLWTNETGTWTQYNITTGLTLSTETETWNRTIEDKTGVIWNVQSCDSTGVCSFASTNYTVEIDTNAPTIDLESPIGTYNYSVVGDNETLNVTFTDANLDSCWYDYNGTNITIEGCVSGVSNSTNFTLEEGNYNITIWVNDTLGNYNSTTYSWAYNITLLDSYYNPSTITGATNPFNITVDGISQVTVAYLNYNNTNYFGSISSSGTTYYVDRNIVAPTVGSTTNITFYWNLTFSNGFIYSLPELNQSVSPITINSTCTGMYSIYNLTLVDELTQAMIDGTLHTSSIKVDLDLYNTDRSTLLKNYYNEFSQTNPSAFCIDNNLSAGEEYSLDLQIQYNAINYSTEIYHIYNYILNSNSLNQNITLYNLPTTNTQKFELLVRDTSYLPIEGALIEIQRKYIENGTFYITEIPKTDADGSTSASLQLNDVIYNFDIYEGGVLVSSFDNVLAICQTPLVSTCSIDFNAILTGIDITNYEDNGGFEFDLGYNSTSKTVTTTFTISSGEPAIILLEVIREDALGTAVCSDTLTSASGTLSCVVPNSFGNSSILAKVYKSGIEQGRGSIKLDQNASDIFGPVLVILSLFVMLTLLGIGISDNPIISAVFLFVGVLLLFAMNLVSNTGFIGATATFLFLAIAIILIIIKAGRRS